MSQTSRASRGLAVVAGLAATVSGLALLSSPPATAASTGLVISEVYGGGGNSGATYTHDFIELYNPTSAPISVDGMSVQYRSSAGTGAGSVTPLSGSVPPGGHYLVQEAQGAGGTTPLPTPDATGTIAMSGTAFTVWLATGTTALSPTADGAAVRAGIVDLVGVNSNTFETAKAAGTANATSSSRSGADTDNNANDFATGAPSPQSAGSTPPEEPEPVEATIAEIQGTGDASPLAGDPVITEGVVTAAYPTGGFNGFYLQTGGTGAGADATPGASDAVFVYGNGGAGQVAIGDSVRVTGEVTEFQGLTEINLDQVTPLATPLAPVVPHATSVPAAADREAHEGELYAPTGDFTVTDNFSTNQYAEIGLAAGDHPLIQPTDVADAQDHAAIAAVVADNADRGVVLDDGASINFLPFGGGANQDVPLPWLSKANPVRVGSAVDFTGPVVLDFRNSTWKFQPTSRVTGSGAEVATFENTRAENAAPAAVGGDIRLATFNVLNYFNTTGADYEAAHPGSCEYFVDRDDDPVTVDDCGPTGPRGAAEDEDLARQQVKIVHAINGLHASIVSLEEIENSVALGEADRDDALSELVDALNADAGAGTWAFVPSPDPADLPPVAEQDVIRTAFIYQPAAVEPVGESVVLTGSPAFGNAREPLAQAFKGAGLPDAEAFAVIVNHFKSKGSGTPDPDGQGNANVDRVAQAEALWPFAEQFAASRGTDEVFLTGDFNSYTQEDPLQVLYGHGYTNLESTSDPDETTYSFDGLSGSLDHVLANPAALEMVTGVDIWRINADESVAFEYSRDNYNVTSFYEENPFRASDHNPEIVGLELPDLGPVAATVEAQDTEAVYSKEPVRVPVRVIAEGVVPTGVVSLLDGHRVLGTATLQDGAAVISLPKKALKRGTYTFTVTYAGDEQVEAGSTEVTVRVTNPAGH
ncbi:ExeM/NucH family extracellular endonuclease [Nocardioides pyridinolyticus]